MKVGDKVNRTEKKGIVGATIIEIDGDNVHLKYDEGGDGWWPVSLVEVIVGVV